MSVEVAGWKSLYRIELVNLCVRMKYFEGDVGRYGNTMPCHENSE